MNYPNLFDSEGCIHLETFPEAVQTGVGGGLIREECKELDGLERDYIDVRSKRTKIYFGSVLYENERQCEWELARLDNEELSIVGDIMDHQVRCQACSA